MRLLLPLLVAPALIAQAPVLPSVDQLLAKHVEAIGGQAKLDAVKSLRMIASIPNASGMDATLTIERRLPDCVRVQVDIMGQSILTVANAQGGSTLNPLMGQSEPKALSPEELTSIRQGMQMGGAFLSAKAQGSIFEVQGLVDVDGAKAYKVKGTSKDGKETSLFFLDATSYQLIRLEAKRPMMGQVMDTKTSFKDFKQVSGLTFPYTQTVEVAGGGVPAQTIEVSTIEVNPVLADARFTLAAPAPAGAQKQ